MPIENRVVLITGASSGFGRLTAEHLARKRYSVIATMRDLSGKNAGAAAELRLLARGESLDLHVAELDVTQDASVDRCVRETIADVAREDQYTAAKEFAPRINAFLEGSKADPMEIAEAILQIIETPAGQRRVRYRVGRGATGVEAINETAAQMQAQLLAGYGLGDLAQFRASSAGAKA